MQGQNKSKAERRAFWKKLCGTALLSLLFLLLLLRLFFGLFSHFRRNDADLLVDVLDVGQSDAILLRCGGDAMLIDTGTASSLEALLRELHACGVSHIRYLVITHPHEDHYGNARALLSEFSVGEVLTPDAPTEEFGFSLLLNELALRAVPHTVAHTGLIARLGGTTIEVLAQGGSEANNASIVLRATHGKVRLLLMGDAEHETENALLSTYTEEDLHCDFLKVGHHGSDTATGSDFALAVRPAVAAISCGAYNEYGFPHEAVLENLEAAGAQVYRTDLEGTLRFASDSERLFCRKEG